MIVFKKIDSINPVVEYLVNALKASIAAKKRTVWFIPGGSSIAIVLEVAKQLDGLDLQGLAVTLTDERYGEFGHPDSNWQQLASNGFSLPGAQLLPVIVGYDKESTTDRYGDMLQTLLTEADYSLGFFGIGPDGHTAGILPGSSAVTAQGLAAAYDAPPYQRITMTPKAIQQLSEAVVYAIGEPKHHVMDELAIELPLDEQPAQILKQVPKVTIFNDYKDNA